MPVAFIPNLFPVLTVIFGSRTPFTVRLHNLFPGLGSFCARDSSKTAVSSFSGSTF